MSYDLLRSKGIILKYVTKRLGTGTIVNLYCKASAAKNKIDIKIYHMTLNETVLHCVKNLKKITQKLVYCSNAEMDCAKTLVKENFSILVKWLGMNWMDIEYTWLTWDFFILLAVSLLLFT